MTRISMALLISFFALFLFGCQTTGDPNQGGLFGWDEKKAQQRQSEREYQVACEKADYDKTMEEQRRLEATKSAKTKRYKAISANVNTVNRDVAALENQLNAVKAEDSATKEKLAALKKRQQSLKAQVAAVGGDPNMDEAAKEAELARLKQEIDKLTREAEALSQL